MSSHTQSADDRCHELVADQRTSSSLENLERVDSLQQFREETLHQRTKLLKLYKPSLLAEKEFGSAAFEMYGYRCIAPLWVNKNENKKIEIIWDMPCIFATPGCETQTLSPQKVMDLVEYDNFKSERKYSLAHMLCLIIEVSPLFSDFKTKYRHDTSFRICNEPKCCNPYHRSVPSANASKIAFLSRFNLFNESFKKQIIDVYAKREIEAENCPSNKRVKLTPRYNVIPTRLFIGTFYSGEGKIDKFDVENRVHFDGNVKHCTKGGNEIEIECVNGSNESIAWVPLRSAIKSIAYPGYIDIIKSIQTIGGNSKLLKLCFEMKNKS